MKAIILLATLKRHKLSHTATLSDFFSKHLKQLKVDVETVKLVDLNIAAGTYTHLEKEDDWQNVLYKLLEADIIIFATPIWWGNHSSETQKAIERLDELHDEILAGKESRLAGKACGIIITGDSDGAQHIIGGISNFASAIGMVVPPYATLSALSSSLAKNSKATREDLMEKFEKEQTKTAKTMAEQLVRYAKFKYSNI